MICSFFPQNANTYKTYSSAARVASTSEQEPQEENVHQWSGSHTHMHAFRGSEPKDFSENLNSTLTQEALCYNILFEARMNPEVLNRRNRAVHLSASPKKENFAHTSSRNSHES